MGVHQLQVEACFIPRIIRNKPLPRAQSRPLTLKVVPSFLPHTLGLYSRPWAVTVDHALRRVAMNVTFLPCALGLLSDSGICLGVDIVVAWLSSITEAYIFHPKSFLQ